MLRLDVRSSRELQAMVLALRGMDKELRSRITRATRAMVEPAWREELNKSGPNALQRATLVQTARTSVSANSLTLKSGTVGKLQHGTKAAEIARAVEFGADARLVTRYRRKGPGKGATVTRHTRPGLGPIRAKGKVVYPALERFVPRAAALYVQTTVRLMYEVFEGKAR
jgi:hypothetical protein